MSIIIVILILSYLGLDFAPQAFAEAPKTETETPNDDTPQTKVLLPPSSTSESNKEKQSLEEQKASFFLKAFGKKLPETYHPHDMKVILDDSFSIQMVVDINPYTQALQFTGLPIFVSTAIL